MIRFKHTEKDTAEIIEVGKLLKSKGYREETNFSLFSTAELMVMYKNNKL